jgi:hypothetical protein
MHFVEITKRPELFPFNEPLYNSVPGSAQDVQLRHTFQHRYESASLILKRHLFGPGTENKTQKSHVYGIKICSLNNKLEAVCVKFSVLFCDVFRGMLFFKISVVELIFIN